MAIQTHIAQKEKIQGWDAVYLYLFSHDLSLGSVSSTIVEKILCVFDFTAVTEQYNVEPDALKEWKIHIFKIVDTLISLYSRNPQLLPTKSKSSFVILNEVFMIFI